MFGDGYVSVVACEESEDPTLSLSENAVRENFLSSATGLSPLYLVWNFTFWGITAIRSFNSQIFFILPFEC